LYDFIQQIVASIKQRIFRFDPMPGLVVFVMDKACVFVCSMGDALGMKFILSACLFIN